MDHGNGTLEHRSRKTALRFVVVACAFAAFSAGVGAAPAGAQSPSSGPVVEVDPGTRLIVVTPPSDFPSRMIVGYNAPPLSFIYFLDLNGKIVPGPGCQFLDPALENLVVCPPPPQVAGIRVRGPGRRFGMKLEIRIPVLPAAYSVTGGGKKDSISGSPNAEKVQTGKGGDAVNPGAGRDQVNSGPGNDTVKSRDGERDQINCGKGKRDVVKPDKKDRIRNCEVVK